MIRFFAAHRTAANILLIGIIALGIAAIPSMKRETFPDIAPDEVEVRVVYPGASAEDVEDAVCSRIEAAVEAVERRHETRCEARENLGLAVIKMDEGHDIDRFTDDIKAEVEGITGFPTQVERPVVRQLGRRDFVAAVAITGPISQTARRAYAEDLKDRMIQIGEVSQVTIRGFAVRQVRIGLTREALRRHGLTVADVAERVRRQNISRPAGLIETEGGDLIVRYEDERRDPMGLHDLVILEGASGGQVRLGDIATLDERFENDWDAVEFNGAPAALLEVTKTKAQDSLDVMDALNAFLDAERARAPPGVVLEVTADMASIVRDRLDTLSTNGIQGLFLVFGILWLFFSPRFSFWVAMGLPVSFMGTFFLMSTFGYSIDMITMVGLLIAIGLLMDDAIVIAENVAAHRRRGASPFDAAVNGTRQVLPGIVASFLTTLCIFGALAFMEGRMGQVLRVMPVVLIMTLAVSLIEAFLILPNHMAHAMAHKDRPSRLRAGFERWFDHFRLNRFGPLVDLAVRWRYLTAGLLFGLALATVALPASGLLKFRAFPDLEGNVAEARILLPQGTPLERTRAVVGEVMAGARAIEDAWGQDGLIRHTTISYGQNRDAFETGAHVATVTVDMVNGDERDGTLDEFLDDWRERVGLLPDVISIKYAEREMGPAGRDIDIRLHGRDLDRIKAASEELQAWLNGYAGVRDLSDDLRPGKPELRLRLKDGAAGLGFTADGIASQVGAAFQGVTVDEFQDAGQTVEIDVRLADADRAGLGDIDDFFVAATTGGALVPLSAVAEISQDRGWARIQRIDGRRTVSVQGVVSAPGNAAEIIGHTGEAFLPGLRERYPDLAISLEGAARETAKTGASVRRNLILGVVGIYLLLAFQFRSYIEPLAVMVAIPMSIVGAFWAHFLLGLELSMPSMVGLAALTGVVVNDTILLVIFVKERVHAGQSAALAAPLAARERFRAIILTSLTTIGGLVPLLLETSMQAQILIPLATSLAFGLTSATVLSLFLVPAIYAIFDDLGLTEHKRSHRKPEVEGHPKAPPRGREQPIPAETS